MATLPPMPTGVRRAFVAYVDTHLGQQVASRLLAQGYEVSGLLRDPTAAASVNPKIKRVLRRGDVDAVRRALLETDVAVYQLVDTVEDAIAALRLLASAHYESEKRFVLVSSVLTWFETPPLLEAPASDGEEAELEAVTEDQYNRRVPHIKYLAWRDAEKLCCTSISERLKTFVVFAGLVYGHGEDVLHPLFKQAWNLAPEGLPIFGSGKQRVPMIHVFDLATAAVRTLALAELPETRYIFAVDEGACTWNDLVNALNTAIGNGKTFRVPRHEFGFHDNVEHFIVNLKVEGQLIQQLLPEDTDWVSRAGFVENVDFVCSQYRKERRVEPLRVVVVGPPSVGKSYAAREIAAAMGVPHFTIADIIQEYKYQETELAEEAQRFKVDKFERRRAERLEEKRATALAELKAAQEAAILERGGEPLVDEDADDADEPDDVDVQLTPEEEAEIRQEVADDDSEERMAQIQEKIEEIKRVCASKQKPVGHDVHEPPNPKDKKKAPPKKKVVEEVKEDVSKDWRLSDKALAFMVRWKLTRTPCRNQGFVLDGFPKTVRQARLTFEDNPIEVPDAPEDAEMPLDPEERPCAPNVFPEFVLHCRAGDTFLLERLQKTQGEHPHNAPEDFQRRLEHHKQHFEVAVGVVQWMESARTTAGTKLSVRVFDMEACPLVPPPAPKSQFAPRVVDPVLLRMIEGLGKPRNFGPTPQDAFREAERVRRLQQEQRVEQDAQQRERREKEAQDLAQARQAKAEEALRVASMKESERVMLEQRKGPLKAYLMANVIPVLTKGLVEVCVQRPEDPVDFLAEWLFKHNPEDHPEMYS